MQKWFYFIVCIVLFEGRQGIARVHVVSTINTTEWNEVSHAFKGLRNDILQTRSQQMLMPNKLLLKMAVETSVRQAASIGREAI